MLLLQKANLSLITMMAIEGLPLIIIIKMSGDELNVHISLLMTSILSHGCVSDDLLVSTVPILQDIAHMIT